MSYRAPVRDIAFALDAVAGIGQVAATFDDMVARLDLPHQRDGDGRHAGRGRARSLRAFERGDALLEHVGRGIHDPRVDVSEFLQREEVRGVLGVAVHHRTRALRRERREPRVLRAQHPVGGKHRERPAARALAEQDGHRRDAESDQIGQAARHLAGGIGAWRDAGLPVISG